MTVDERRPQPFPGTDHGAVFDAYRRHELLADQCAGCRATMLPIGPSCLLCGSADISRVAIPAPWIGTIYSVSVSTRGFLGFEEAAPYAVALVDVDGYDGLRVAGNLVPAPAAHEWREAIGRTVGLVWVTYRDEVVLPQWRFVDAARVVAPEEDGPDGGSGPR